MLVKKTIQYELFPIPHTLLFRFEKGRKKGKTFSKTYSADNPFKQFGPRSGPTFCPDLIGVQTVSNFRGYNKLELNQCFIFAFNLNMTLSADDIC